MPSFFPRPESVQNQRSNRTQASAAQRYPAQTSESAISRTTSELGRSVVWAAEDQANIPIVYGHPIAQGEHMDLPCVYIPVQHTPANPLNIRQPLEIPSTGAHLGYVISARGAMPAIVSSVLPDGQILYESRPLFPMWQNPALTERAPRTVEEYNAQRRSQ